MLRWAVAHLIKEGELALAAGLVAELRHADCLPIGLLYRKAQDVPAMQVSYALHL